MALRDLLFGFVVTGIVSQRETTHDLTDSLAYGSGVYGK